MYKLINNCDHKLHFIEVVICDNNKYSIVINIIKILVGVG